MKRFYVITIALCLLLALAYSYGLELDKSQYVSVLPIADENAAQGASGSEGK